MYMCEYEYAISELCTAYVTLVDMACTVAVGVLEVCYGNAIMYTRIRE